jgi:hypothetical protein
MQTKDWMRELADLQNRGLITSREAFVLAGQINPNKKQKKTKLTKNRKR